AAENFDRVFRSHGLPDDIAEKVIPAVGEIWLPRLLTDCGLVKGTGEARRLIKQNAVSLNGQKISDGEYQVPATGEVLLQVGKRRFCKVIFG
ncbi:MAG: tyrosine--tRNA ligase, partial [Deltaproteobacteria bacterium]|nr:tyrosine--tRNA ligase [Deltaproteobacteria bacterium]